MGKYRFVKPEVARLDLSDGDWIDVKRYLTYGEQQRITGSSIGKMRMDQANPEVGVDWEKFSVVRLSTWIVDWSFVDESDKRVRVTSDAIRELHPDTIEEIDKVLTSHIEALEELKKVPRSKTEP